MADEARASLPDDIIAALKKPLPKEAISKHPTRTYLSSIKAIFVVERLNEVFGLNGWKQTIEGIEKITEPLVIKGAGKNGADKFLPAMVVLRSKLTIPKYGIEHENFGGNDNEDLGDAFKGALTDALTKMASYVYIGIDVFKGLGDAPSRAAEKTGGTAAASTAPRTPACADCKQSVKPLKVPGKKDVLPEQIVAKAMQVFGRPLCAECGKKAAAAAEGTTPAPAKKAAAPATNKPKAAHPPMVEHVPDSDWKEIDGQITGVSTRKITSSKGSKVVTEIEFNGFDGKITSWHTEHVNPALQKAKGKQAVIVFSTKVNGRYTNHTLEKLLFLDGVVWEDNKPARSELDNDADDFVNNYPDDKQ